MTYNRSEAQCADTLTDNIGSKVKWFEAIELIGIRAPGGIPILLPEPGPRPPKEEEEEQGPKDLPKGKKALRQERGRRACPIAGAPAPVERSPAYEVLLWRVESKRTHFCLD